MAAAQKTDKNDSIFYQFSPVVFWFMHEHIESWKYLLFKASIHHYVYYLQPLKSFHAGFKLAFYSYFCDVSKNHFHHC